LVRQAADPADYLIGEKFYKSNPNNTKALRVMFKQILGAMVGMEPDE
jgi:hypothetical protein